MATEKIYDLWARRNPQWEKRYEDSIIKTFAITVEELHLYARIEAKSLAEVMKYLLSHFLWGCISTKKDHS